jgi:hypothetical protein
MPVATQTDGDVSIAIARDPALVRTVRLVAAAVARRADCTDAQIEEVRLAVGEACAVMIGLEEDTADGGTVEVRLHAGEAFEVSVSGAVSAEQGEFAQMGLDPWALMRGLAEDVTVTDEGASTTVRMSWRA